MRSFQSRRATLSIVAVLLLVATANAPGPRADESICQRGDILGICDDWSSTNTMETNNPATGWYDWNSSSVRTPVVDPAFGYNGGRALRLDLSNNPTQNVADGGSGAIQTGLVRHLLWAPGTATATSIGTGQSLYCRTYVYWQPGFMFVPGGSGSKFFYFNSWNGGTSNWRVRWSYFNPTGSATGPFGDPTIARLQFDAEPADSRFGPNQGPFITFVSGQWYAVEMYVKLNTPGQSDGEVKWWINGALQGWYANWSVRGSRTENLNGISIDGYFGGAEANVHPAQSSWYDNVVCSRNPIGLVGGSSAPSSATSVTVQ